MLRFNISLVICFIVYITPICSANFLTYCTEKKESTLNGFCEIYANSSSLIASEEKDEKGLLKLVLITSMSKCSFDHLTLELEITNATDTKACNVVDSKFRVQTHSYAEYEFESEKSCTKSNFTMEMDHIYTGCYIMTFSLQRRNGSRKITVEPLVFSKWISNNYKAEDFRVKKPIHTLNDLREGTEINVYFDTAIIQKKYNYSLEIYKSESESNHIAKDMSTSYSFPIDVKNNCTITAEKITCVYRELPSGTYKLYFNLEDVPWCLYLDGVFSNECSWKVDFEVGRHVDSNKETSLPFQSWPQIEWVHNALLGLLCLVVLVLFVLVYVSRQNRYSRKKIMVSQWKSAVANVSPNTNRETRAEADCRESVSGILLLYARDCQPFMQAMEHFRELLQAETGSEVYDLFDYRRFDEISRSPNEWIQGRLQEPCMKTVLVGTRCADLVYHNLLQRCQQPDERHSVPKCTLYQNPEFLDGVVLHAIKMVSLDVYYQRPYQKYFVSYIPNFSSDNTLSQINPFKRYALPVAAMRLVADLCRPSDTPPGPHISLAPLTLHQLRDSLDRLGDYVASRPNYLHTDILKEG